MKETRENGKKVGGSPVWMWNRGEKKEMESGGGFIYISLLICIKNL